MGTPENSLRSYVGKNFGLIATLLGFVLDSIALIALISSGVRPTIPIIDYELDFFFLLTLWLMAFISYLGFLREKWSRISRKLSTRPQDTFSGFLLYDLFLGFKHPFHLIPFVILFATLIKILTLSIDFVVILFLLICTGLAVAFIALVSIGEVEQNKWKGRIEKELLPKGYVTNFELARMYTEDLNSCNNALKSYHTNFEERKNLIYVFESIGNSSQPDLKMWVVAYRKLADTRPWLQHPSISLYVDSVDE